MPKFIPLFKKYFWSTYYVAVLGTGNIAEHVNKILALLKLTMVSGAIGRIKKIVYLILPNSIIAFLSLLKPNEFKYLRTCILLCMKVWI